jgi:hypothetical protein
VVVNTRRNESPRIMSEAVVDVAISRFRVLGFTRKRRTTWRIVVLCSVVVSVLLVNCWNFTNLTTTVRTGIHGNCQYIHRV